MIQSIIHTTKNKNLYLYDDHHRLSMLVHPEFEKAFEKSTDADQYYVKKYAYLRDYRFFTKTKHPNFITLEESMIKESIIQTNQIVFETTDNCNLKCSYCAFGEYYEGFDARNFKKINTRNAITLLNYIFDLNIKNKNRKLGIAFYGGEPLLNMRFIKQIVEVSNHLNAEKELDISFLMTTNGTLLHKYIAFLVEKKFNLLISLDGNERNNSYRVYSKNNKNSFHKIVENIDMIQKDYPNYFISHVNFNAVLHNRNSVKDIFNFIFCRYNKIPRIAQLSLDDTNPIKKDVLEKMFRSKLESETEYQKEESNLLPHDGLFLYSELTDYLKYFSINFYISNVAFLLQEGEKYLPTCTCIPFSKKIFLTNRNRLLPCEKINYKYTLGIVDENVEIDIPKITQQFNFYYKHFKNKCQHCYIYRFCGLCMFQIENLDKLDTEELVCGRFHDQKAFQNKLYNIFSFLEKYPNDFFQILENIVIE